MTRSLTWRAVGPLTAAMIAAWFSVGVAQRTGTGLVVRPPILTGHTNVVHTVVFSPDGNLLAWAT